MLTRRCGGSPGLPSLRYLWNASSRERTRPCASSAAATSGRPTERVAAAATMGSTSMFRPKWMRRFAPITRTRCMRATASSPSRVSTSAQRASPAAS